MLLFFLIYFNTGQLESKCDRPLSYWLLTMAWIAAALPLMVYAVQNYVRKTSTLDADGKRKVSPTGKWCVMLMVLLHASFCVWFVFGNAYLWATFSAGSLSNVTKLDVQYGFFSTSGDKYPCSGSNPGERASNAELVR
jgi:hypothetical protein